MVSRRNFLTLGGLSGAALALSACRAVSRKLADGDLPAALTPVEAAPTLVRLLNRAGYGPRR